jgi:hypothetical protein
LWLEKDGRQIGYGEYHLIGKGGLSLMKWEETKTKMDPMIDALLWNIVVGTSMNKKELQRAQRTKQPSSNRNLNLE